MGAVETDFVFKTALAKTIDDEGGYKVVDDPDDPGGRTKAGISTRFLRGIGDQRKVDDLSETDIAQLYYDYFWLEYKIDQIAPASERLATKVFNFCVTAGPDPAFRCLQRALRANDQDVKEDGVMGPMTRGRVNAVLALPCGPAALIAAYKAECAGYYRDLDKPKYETGWVNRAYRG